MHFNPLCKISSEVLKRFNISALSSWEIPSTGDVIINENIFISNSEISEHLAAINVMCPGTENVKPLELTDYVPEVVMEHFSDFDFHM